MNKLDQPAILDKRDLIHNMVRTSIKRLESQAKYKMCNAAVAARESAIAGLELALKELATLIEQPLIHPESDDGPLIHNIQELSVALIGKESLMSPQVSSALSQKWKLKGFPVITSARVYRCRVDANLGSRTSDNLAFPFTIKALRSFLGAID